LAVQDLIAQVTSPEEWVCGHACDDKNLLELLTGMMQKDPESRFPLDRVEQCAWVAAEVKERKAGGVEWSKIVVNEADLRSAISHGHVNNFKRKPNGTLLKLTEARERTVYDALRNSELKPWLPKMLGAQAATGKRVVLTLEDLTFGMKRPCVMDVKMGSRNFTEDEAHKKGEKPRPDMLQKMVKIKPDAATEEEKAAGGVTKLRYLRFRDDESSSATLGFRVDNVQLSEQYDSSDVPDIRSLALVKTRARIRAVVCAYVQKCPELLISFVQQLRDLRATLAASDAFATHCCTGGSGSKRGRAGCGVLDEGCAR
jgi:hypothetical protein